MIILILLGSPVLMVDAEPPDQDQPEPLTGGVFTFDEPLYLSEDGSTLYNANLPKVLLAHPDGAPSSQAYTQPPDIVAAIAGQGRATATFAITYLGVGDKDVFGTDCTNFPPDARSAFDAAAAIWASRIKSPVPITITACWATGLAEGVLGYSGGSSYHRDFDGAPRPNTWYQAALANSLAGVDLAPTNADMHIAYSSTFNWYTGTDGNPGAGQYDLVTVAAHEIAHGLHFSGLMEYAGGQARYGFGTGYPSIYDTFMEDGAGTLLTAYENPSTAMGSLVTSNNLWWGGTNAKAANSGQRVKMYAPSSWSGGSSYSHLDYVTFSGTGHRMMVFAYVSAIHDPGAITMGILEDMGWQITMDDPDPDPTPTHTTTEGPTFTPTATPTLAPTATITSTGMPTTIPTILFQVYLPLIIR